jgi:hypothetical protein
LCTAIPLQPPSQRIAHRDFGFASLRAEDRVEKTTDQRFAVPSLLEVRFLCIAQATWVIVHHPKRRSN